MVDEILDTRTKSCPPEYMNIPIPKEHEYYANSVRQMPFVRSRYYPGTGESVNSPRDLVGRERLLHY